MKQFWIGIASCALGLAIGAGAQAQQSPAATPGAPRLVLLPEKPEIDPKAMAILKAAGDRLAGARTLSFTAVATYESPALTLLPLAYTTLSRVTLQRPNKLQVITEGDGPASEFYYDGKSMIAYAPAENLIAVASAPSTIDAALPATSPSSAEHARDAISCPIFARIASGFAAVGAIWTCCGVGVCGMGASCGSWVGGGCTNACCCVGA